jgi:hypothetical protein
MMERLRELFLNNTQVESLTAGSVLMSIAVAALCGLAIFAVYRWFNKGVVYNPNFNLLIVMVCVVTAFIIITIGANLVLTLGMVGALSIVRFRAAVKDPLDVGFLFWGVAAGLTAGARLYLVALLGTACIALLYIGMTFLKLDKRSFLLIIRCEPPAEAAVLAHLSTMKYKLKNKTLAGGGVELTAEVKVVKNNASFVDPLQTLPGVTSAVLVEYAGDYV